MNVAPWNRYSKPKHLILLNLFFFIPKIRGCIFSKISACFLKFIPNFIFKLVTVMSDSLQFHGLQPFPLLCPWNFPGKNTRVGCHFLLQGIFLTRGLNPGLLHWRQILSQPSHQGSPNFINTENISNFNKVFSLPIKIADTRKCSALKKKKKKHKLWVQRHLGLNSQLKHLTGA